MRIPAPKWAWLLACAVLACACTPRRQPANPQSEAFDAFLSRIPRLSTPANIPLNWAVPPSTTPSSAQDSAFCPPGTPVFGYISRPDGHVDIFYAAQATDYPLPIIGTWRQGVEIERIQLGLGGCGSGECGFECSEELILIAPGAYQSKLDMRWRWCHDGLPTDSIISEETQLRSLTADGSGRLRIGEE